MNIAGHVGFTFVLYEVIRKYNKSLILNNLIAIAIVALLPDILDRTIHLIIPKYPAHGIFHSVFFYASSLLFAVLLFRRIIIYLAIMMTNVAFDIVNVSLRAFMYPVYGWTEDYVGQALPSPVKPFLDHWPQTIGYKLPTGHYLLFELAGILLIILIISKRIISSKKA